VLCCVSIGIQDSKNRGVDDEWLRRVRYCLCESECKYVFMHVYVCVSRCAHACRWGPQSPRDCYGVATICRRPKLLWFFCQTNAKHLGFFATEITLDLRGAVNRCHYIVCIVWHIIGWMGRAHQGSQVRNQHVGYVQQIRYVKHTTCYTKSANTERAMSHAARMSAVVSHVSNGFLSQI